MTSSELAEKLTVIADKAQLLRDAGVVGRVEVGEVSFEIGEALAPAVAGPKHEDSPSNPLDDPETYGGFVPQRRVFFEPTLTADEEDDD